MLVLLYMKYVTNILIAQTKLELRLFTIKKKKEIIFKNIEAFCGDLIATSEVLVQKNCPYSCI